MPYQKLLTHLWDKKKNSIQRSKLWWGRRGKTAQEQWGWLRTKYGDPKQCTFIMHVLGIQGHRHQNSTRKVEIRQQHCFSSYVYLPFKLCFFFSANKGTGGGAGVLTIGKVKVGITSGQNCSRTGNCLFPFAYQGAWNILIVWPIFVDVRFTGGQKLCPCPSVDIFTLTWFR